jgi:hypothetical protein
MIGKKLQHPDLGSCVVTKVINSSEVEVSFLGLGIKGKRQKLSSLVDPETGYEPIISRSADDELVTSHSLKVETLDDEMLKARLAILALRLGQCPESHIDEMTVGNEEVKEACEWALDRSHGGKPAIVVFESPFGKGKTHALNVFSSMARKRFRAVGSVVLDGIGITLTEPMTLLSNLAASIRFPEEQGFETLPERLCDLVRSRRVDRLRANSADFLADRLDRVPHEIADLPDAWEIVVDYLSCILPASQAAQQLAPFRENARSLSLPAIVANRVGERADRCVTMLREWAQACMVVGAHRGLLVLFDEADVDYGNTGFSSKMVERREWLYQSISELATSHQKSYLSIGIAITPGEDNYWGVEAVDEILNNLDPRCTRHVQLRDLTKRDFIQLGKRVATLYAKAYGSAVFSPKEAEAHAEKLRSQMELRVNDSCLPRRFIREFIECLDLEATK